MKLTVTEKAPRQDEHTVFVNILDEKKERFVEGKRGELTLSLGLKPRKRMTRTDVQTLVRRALLIVKEQKAKCLVFSFSDFGFASPYFESEAELASFIVQNAYLANFAFTQFKTNQSAKRDIKELVLLHSDAKQIIQGAREGRIIGEEVNKCRILANTPGGDMTPILLAQKAEEAIQGTAIKITIFDQKKMEKLGMHAILGVAKGSTEEPRFIILEYKGAEKSEQSEVSPIVLVGKGVTFDTGGLNLKPADGINDMHLDMSGGAAVIHAITLAARLKIKKNIVALIPAVENMPSGSSYRPGDILKTLSGKTIEVLNTDAEGRIILADALTYAKQFNPRLVVDVATLTGAALVALGEHAHAVMTRDKDLQELLMRLGEESGEHTWPLPLWDVYEQYIPGTFGDVANLAVGTSPRNGGTINGGMFLYQFTKEYPKTTKWAHIDMAPRMVAAPGDNLAKGATGEPVRLLYRLVKEY